MRLRLTKIDEFQFLTCLDKNLWGSRTARFKDWRPGDYLAILVDKALAGLAQVSGPTYVSKERVWDNGVFPHRIPLKFVHALLPENRPPVLGQVRDALTSDWGPKYGWGILNQNLLAENAAEVIVHAITSRENNLSNVRRNIETYLSEARLQRDARAAKRVKRSPRRKLSPPPVRAEEEVRTGWLRQNAPLCAFEVETTTSVYSGLLRMADLLALVPALNMKLFVVAPKERQAKVMAELGRPTFEKIGLSEFCRFVRAEDLRALFEGVAKFEGHVQPSIIDTISMQSEEDIESVLK